MQIKTFYTYLAICLCVCSCGTFKKNDDQIITFDQVAQLPLGSSKKTTIEHLGKPTLKFGGHEDGRPFELWIYKAEKPFRYQRLSVSFSESGIVDSKWINPLETEPEFQLAYLEKKFGPPLSPPYRMPSCTHVAITDDLLYKFPNGVTVSFRDQRKEVSGISWSDPVERDLAWAKPRSCGPRKKIIEIK